MGKRPHPEVAAARHMSSGVKTSDYGDADTPSASTVPAAVVRAGSQSIRTYRRQRTVAWVLAILVMAAVPALIAVLVLFG